MCVYGVVRQIELHNVKATLQQLDVKTSKVETQNRTRMLGGTDLSAAELSARVTSLEARVAQKEEKYLELALVHDETCKLIERARKQVDSNKGDTLALAKHIADSQSKLRDVTVKTKAVVAELCMYQVCLSSFVGCYML